MKLPVPEIKSYFCSDVPDLESWAPNDDYWIVWIDLSIGAVGEVGADFFTACVASPRGLSAENQRRVSRGLSRIASPVVVQEYDWPTIQGILERQVATCTGPSWLSIQDQLRLMFSWEYEGMSWPKGG